jgi:kynurenine formamidase
VKERAVLIQTGWDQHWRTDQYFEGHPFLTGDAAQLLSDRGASWWASTLIILTTRLI